MQLGVVEPERLDLNDDMSSLRLGLRDVLVDEAVQPTEFLENDGAHYETLHQSGPPPLSSCEAGAVAKSVRKKGADFSRDHGGMRLQREMAGVEEAHLRVGDVARERFRSRRQEERIVLAPHCQERRLVGAEIVLKGRVKRDAAFVVAKLVQLNLVYPGGGPNRNCRVNSRPETHGSCRTRRAYIAKSSSRARGRIAARSDWP